MSAGAWNIPAGDRFMAAEITRSEGAYQRDHLERALPYCKQFRTAIDGGTHVGTWTVPLSRRFARVFAFEPAADAMAALVANVDRHGCGNAVLFRRAALGDAPGTVSLALDDQNRDRGNLGARHVVDGGDVKRITIDSLGIIDLDFLKLDIEGSEPFALDGARMTLARFRPVVIFEDKGFCCRYGFRRDAPHQILTSLGALPIERVGMDEIWDW
jgi:FkbM family methyltransferase